MAVGRLTAPPADRRHRLGLTRVRDPDPPHSPCGAKISPRGGRLLAAQARRPDYARGPACQRNRAAGCEPSPARRPQTAHVADRSRAAPGHPRDGGLGNRRANHPGPRDGVSRSSGRACHHGVRRGRGPDATVLRAPKRPRALTLAVRSPTSWPGRGNLRPWLACRSGGARRRVWAGPVTRAGGGPTRPARTVVGLAEGGTRGTAARPRERPAAPLFIRSSRGTAALGRARSARSRTAPLRTAPLRAHRAGRPARSLVIADRATPSGLITRGRTTTAAGTAGTFGPGRAFRSGRTSSPGTAASGRPGVLTASRLAR